MPVTLTIKQVPDELAERLRALAARNHRSLQGELMHTLEALAACASSDLGKANTAYQTKIVSSMQTSPTITASTDQDDLLDQLDAIVAGSQWGAAPLLSREQANDRALTREFEHLAQEREAPYRR